MTVAEVLRRGRRAIVTFEQNDYLREIFLPEVNHIWANTDKLDRLQVSLRRANRTDSFVPMHPATKSFRLNFEFHGYDFCVVSAGNGVLSQR